MNNNNQFDFMKFFMNQENFMKTLKLMPNMDPSSFSNIIKDTADAISATSGMAAESIQSIIKRGADSFQKNANEMFNSMKEAVSSGDVEQMANCQHKYLKSALENNLNNAKEIIDMTSKSTIEIIEVIGKNMTGNVNKTFFGPQKPL